MLESDLWFNPDITIDGLPIVNHATLIDGFSKVKHLFDEDNCFLSFQEVTARSNGNVTF